MSRSAVIPSLLLVISRRAVDRFWAAAGAALLVVAGGCALGPTPTWTPTTPMQTVRIGHSATLMPDGSVLVAGGADGTEVRSSAEVYDVAADSWSSTGEMLQARGGHTATLLADGSVLVAGGYVWRGLNSALDSAERYDPARGRWKTAGTMNAIRNAHTATLLPDGRVLVVGGYSSAHANPNTVLASAELYDPATGSWTLTGEMSEARYDHSATLLADGRVLVVGGRTNRNALTSAELYDPASGMWTAAGEMAADRYRHTATLLPDGGVLVTGGGGTLAYALASAEIYDPVSGSWAATADLPEGRTGHTATLLPDGKILVAGGSNNPDDSGLASALLYDPASGSWTAAATMVRARTGHSATLLPDGAILVAGGTEGGLLARTDAEVYGSSSQS